MICNIKRRAAETDFSGEWRFHDTLTFLATAATIQIQYTVKNSKYTSIYVSNTSAKLLRFGGGTLAYLNGNWFDSAYKNIYFEEAPTGEFLEWLKQNAEKV